ncbi:CYFA0S01e15082g1_1 [Cyberlindnera fabianii]|uniref:CYFA0S01e15082g1_1 n=1 Tax=Cyberlindnera fabianii TaxID=36022 RepID=A0A061AJC7_CYBFA|nr:CYFA0S01e15082g1_1 [Cyberlindnera fabianii]
MLAIRNALSTTAAPVAAATTTTRLFTTSALRLLKDTSKNSAIALDINTKVPKSAEVGNSFSSFAEYRKSAISHGPLAKKLSVNKSNNEFDQVLSEARHYSEAFSKAARHLAYRE